MKNVNTPPKAVGANARPTVYREPRATSARGSAEIAAGLSAPPAFSLQPLCSRDDLWPPELDRLRLFLRRRPTNLRLCLALQIRRGCWLTSSQPDSHSSRSSLCYDLAS